MKIRRKISLIFTLLTTIVLLCSFSCIYFFTAKNIENDFYSHLFEKAKLTAWKYFEKDEMNTADYSKVIEKYIQLLSVANEIILNSSDTTLVNDSLKKILPYKLIQQLKAGKEIKFRIHEKQGVGLYYPDNQGNFYVLVFSFDNIGNKQQRSLLNLLIVIFVLSLIFIYFMGLFYARNVISPIAHILKNVKKIHSTNLNLRLKETTGEDELAELIRMLNQMLDRLEDSFNMQKRFISNASHELKNPLTAILGESEIALQKQRTGEEYVNSLLKVYSEAERLDELIKNLLHLAQVDFDFSKMKQEQIIVQDLIQEIIADFEKSVYKNRIVLNLSSSMIKGDFIHIQGNWEFIRIAFNNLLENACKFSGQQKVYLSLETDKKNIHIQIIDTGIGISQTEMSNLFQPFFRASNSFNFKGSGIGLSLSEKILKQHGGNINIKSQLNKGTVIDVFLPCS